MSKEYDIKVHVDLSQSDAALAGQAQQFGQVAARAKQSGDAQEAAATKAATAQVASTGKATDAQFVSFLKLDAQASKLSDKLGRDAQRTADKQAKESQRAADAQVRASQKAFDASFVSSLKLENQASKLSDKLADQADKVAQRQTAAADRAKARLDAMAGRALTDEEVRAKALGNINQRLNDKRVDLATKVAEKERWGAMSVREKFSEIGGTILDKVNPATVAFGAATAVVGVGVALIAEHWKNVAKGIEDSIKFTNEYREAMPENAALKGHLGDTTLEAKDSLVMRSKTLQTREQAKTFEEGILNSGQVSIGSKITQTEFDKLKVKAGSFQSAEGGDAKTHGEFAGQLPALMKLEKDATGKEIPLTSDQVIGKMSKLFDISQLGRSSFSSATKQLLENASLTQTGSFKSIDQQSAIQNAFSLHGPDDAGTKVRWLENATVGNIDRNRKSSITGSDVIGEYLKKLGVQEGMKSIPIADLISKDLTKQQNETKAKGKDFNATEYLRHKGFANDEHTRALTIYNSLDQGSQLPQFFARADAKDDSATIQDKIAASRADPMMQDRSRKVTDDLAQFSFKRSHATADAFRRQAFNLDVADQKSFGKYEDNQSVIYNPLDLKRTQATAEDALQRSGRKVGVKIDDFRSDPIVSGQAFIDRDYQNAIDKIQAAGGDPLADLREEIEQRTVANLDRSMAAEAPGRAGLAKKEQEERKKQAVQDRFGIPPMLARPIDAPPGLAPGIDPVAGMMQQLLGMTQEQIILQKEAATARAAANRLMAQNQPKVANPPPLPITGVGRIPTRP